MFGKNNPGDDFSFDDGMEFFPLDDPFAGSNTTPPKGVKGYLKNVVKSVKNAGVKLGEIYMPDVVSLINEIKPDSSDTGSETIKKGIEYSKATIKKYGGGAINISKDIGNDIKNAIKTGNFISNGEMDGMDFGGFGDDDEGEVFDYGDDDQVQSDSKKASIKSVKIAKASMTGATKIGNAQIGATIGTTQAKIKSDTNLFSQSMIIGQEQHQQKIKLMRNIAVNVGKIIKQNNLSLKAQMEYSLKSLAFSQDGTAMIKHIRDAQWKQIAPKEVKENAKGEHEDVFGNGFSKEKYINLVKDKSVNRSQLSMLKMVKEMMESMGDMMSPTQMVKSIVGDGLFGAASKSLLSKNTRKLTQKMNDQAIGAPMAINNVIGRISKDPNFLNKLLKSDSSKLSGIGSMLSTGAEYAHVDNMIKPNSGRFDMGSPNEVHPFDNKAHKVLTDVIPAQLSKISAGINNTEEEYFDFKNNRFATRSNFKKALNQEKDEVLTYSEGYGETIDSITNSIKSEDKADKAKFRKYSQIMLKALFEVQEGLTEDQIKALGDSNSDLYTDVVSGIPEEDQAAAMEHFIAGLISLRKEQPTKYRQLQNSMNQYALRMTNVYREHEENMGTYGSSILFDETTRNLSLDVEGEKIDRQLRAKNRLLDKYNETESAAGMSHGLRKGARSGVLELKRQKRDIEKMKASAGSVAINDGMTSYSSDDTDNSSEDKYEMKMLSNTTTNGVVKNIYRLLLSGIDVYSHKTSSKERNGLISQWQKATLKNKIDFKEAESERKASSEEAINSSIEAAKTDREFREANYEEYTEEGSEFFNKIFNLPGLKTLGKVANSLFGAVADPVSKVVDKNLYGIFDEDEEAAKKEKSKLNAEKTEKTKTDLEAEGDIKLDTSAFKEQVAKVKNSKVGKSFNKYKKIVDDAVSKQLGKIIVDKKTKKTLADVLAEIKDVDLLAKLDKETSIVKKVNVLMSSTNEEIVKYKGEIQKYINKHPALLNAQVAEMKMSSDLKKSFNAGGIKGVASKISTDSKNFITGSNIYNDAKDSFKEDKEAFNKEIKALKNSPTGKAFIKYKKMVTDAIDKKFGEIVVDKKTKKTLAELLTEIKDAELLAKLKNAKTPKEKYDILMSSTNAEIVKCKGSIQDHINKHPKILNIQESEQKTAAALKKSFKDGGVSGVTSKIVHESKNLIGDKLLLNIKVDKVTLETALDESKNETLKAMLRAEKDPIKKAYIIINNGGQEFEPYYEQLRQFISTKRDYIEGSAIGALKANAMKFATDKVGAKINNIIKNKLDKKLSEIKFGKTTLGEVINNIKDPIFQTGLSQCKTTLDKANFILEYGPKEIDNYKMQIKHFINTAKDDDGTVVGSVKTVTNFILKKFFGKNDKGRNASDYIDPRIKNIIGNTGVKLGTEIGNILSDEGLGDEFSLMKNPVDQARYLIENGGRKIKPYIKELKSFINGKEKIRKVSTKYSHKIKKVSNSYESKISKIENDDSLSDEEKQEKIAALKNSESLKKNKLNKKRIFSLDKLTSRKEGTLKDQFADRNEEKKADQMAKQTASLGIIASFFNKAKTHGINLSDKTTDKLEDAAEMAGASGGASASSGLLGKLGGLLDNTGLGKTKAGKILSKGTKFFGAGAGGTALSAGKSLIKKTFGLAGGATKGLAKGAVGATKGVLGVGKVGLSAGKGIAGGIGKTASVLSKGVGFIKGLITKILTNPTIAKVTGKTAAKTLASNIGKQLGKFAAKFVSKISTIFASAGTMALAGAAVGFTKGMTTARKTFGLGVGAKPSIGMRMVSGLVGCLDGALMGIPGIIAKLLGKGSCAAWFYELVGSKAEKEAIARYERYNVVRAKIYGIEDPKSLVSYENHNVVDKVGRAALHVLTFGLAKSNDEKEASMLGFKDVKIFKMWKDEKYKPLADLRKDLAEPYGGLSKVDKLYTFTADGDKDGEIAEDEEAEATKENEAIEMQQEFRQHFLEEARKYIISKKLAWLSNSVDLKTFEKMTGQKGTVKTSTKSKLKSALGYAAVGLVAGPAGIAVMAAIKHRKAIKAGAGKVVDITKKGIVGAGKAIGKVAGSLASKFKSAGKAVLSKVGDIKDGIKSTASALKDKVMSGLKNVGTGIKNFIGDTGDKIITKQLSLITEFYSNAIKKFDIKDPKLNKCAMNAVKKMCNAVRSACGVDKGFALAFVAGAPGRGIKLNAASWLAKHTMNKATSPEEISDNLGVDIPEGMIDDKLRLISAMIALVNSVTDYMDEAVQIVLHKTARYLIYDIIMNEKTSISSSGYEASFKMYANILGVKDVNLKAFEMQIAEENGVSRILNKVNLGAIIASKIVKKTDPDYKYKELLEFQELKIYKYWYSKKYKGLLYLGKELAKNYNMSFQDLMSETTGDATKQKNFLKVFLIEAKKFVKENGIEWLTSKTTLEEFNDRKKNKSLEIKNGYEDAKKTASITSSSQKAPTVNSVSDTSGTSSGLDNVDTNSFVIDATSDASLIQDDLKKRYEYSEKTVAVISSASSEIKGFWKSISPNFYGDQKATNMTSSAGSGEELSFGGKGGGGGSTTEGLVIVDKTKRTPSSTNKSIHGIGPINNKNTKNSTDDSYDMSGKTPKSRVMNSIVSDFTRKFGKELNEKLDILKEIQTENLRHNGVAENFFSATLAMLSQMAKQGGNVNLGSDIDRLVGDIIR